MAGTERGLQIKSTDNNRQQWEGGEFPMVRKRKRRKKKR